ncbi:PQQ-binding-like beta-propeller repeat protein [Streptomyces sp. WMMB303]|uniref:outer membrane protein assembly factor BamB family protein n=1 Tax=Streptomyces sp. WMMB303 TaxID=3034154 RepID=UPI0023ED3379|nr:PQQ-binding-like beta-propeller repeat protein [Streptomyces sp. WMMB303]MDF4252511.1 PQQ-binding-like beta-propeller repeat protein [Streptomyces sp. WMMB303]
MERLRQDDPRRLGPYGVLGRLDRAGSEVRPTSRRFLGRSADGDRTVLISTVRARTADAASLHRFRAEALAAQQITADTPWLLPVSEVSGPAEPSVPPWNAAPYRPALPLPTVVETCGPLPLRTVLAVGTALGEALEHLHAAGRAHAGITADAVLLTGEGPRLGGYGAARVSAPDGEPRTAHPFLAPEQITGGRPRPPGDVYALAAVLRYAVTGRLSAIGTAAEPSVPDPAELTALLRACLAADPSDRPSAAEFLRRLPRCGTGANVEAEGHSPRTVEPARPGGSQSRGGPGSTVPDGGPAPGRDTQLDNGASRAAGLLVPGWLPKRVSAALAVQTAAVLAAETDEDPSPAPASAPVPTQADGAAPADGSPPPPAPRDPAAATTTRRPRAPSRRSLLTAAGAGAAGVAVGGSFTWAVTDQKPPVLSPAEQLEREHPSRKRLKGAPPTPRWRYDFTEPARKFSPLLWQDKVALLADGTAATGIDIRTGEEIWRHTDTSPSGRAWPLHNGLILLAGSEDLLVLDPRDGEIRWRSERYRKGGPSPCEAVLAAQGTVVWLVVGNQGSVDRRTVVAYDIRAERERWTSPLLAGYQDCHLLADALVVVTGAKGGAQRVTAFDRKTGDRTWSRTYETVKASRLSTIATPATLVATEKGTLRGFGLRKSAAKEQWMVEAEEVGGKQPAFGTPISRRGTVYVADTGCTVYRVEGETGDVTWSSRSSLREPAPHRKPPRAAVTPDGRLLLTADDAEVAAFDTARGVLLWRFTDLPTGSGRVLRPRRVALGDTHVLVLSGGSAYALPVSRD